MSETPAENTAPATATEGEAAPATEAAITPKEGGETSESEGEGSTNPAEGGKADKKPGETDEKKEEAKPAVPETYDFTPPDGMEIDKDALKSYEDLAREHGLSQDQFDAVTQHGLEFFQNRLSDLASQHAAREEGWKNEALQDKALSDGKSLKPEVMANVAHVFDQFGGEDNALRTALVETGAGNHPSVIRALNDIDKALGAAQTPDKGKPASELKDNSYEAIAQRRYGSN